MAVASTSSAQVVEVESREGDLVSVDAAALRLSATAAASLKEAGLEEEGGSLKAPIALDVPIATLRLVLRWCDKHKKDPRPYRPPPPGPKTLPAWDADFLNRSRSELVDLLLTAQQLAIPPLMDFTAQAIANTLRGKSIQELQQIFSCSNKKPHNHTH